MLYEGYITFLRESADKYRRANFNEYKIVLYEGSSVGDMSPNPPSLTYSELKDQINKSNEKTIDYLKAEITYYDRSENIVNTDETYAVGGDELQPGERRKFEWYTSGCYDCAKARINLKFD